MRCSCLAVLATLAMYAASAPAAQPQTISYQGYLTSSAAVPVNTTVSIVFKIWDAASGGAQLWTETQPTVVVANGVFNVVLGSVTPITLPFDAPYYLGVAVGGDGEMAPRKALTASPYAFRAASTAALEATATVAGSQITGAITNATFGQGFSRNSDTAVGTPLDAWTSVTSKVIVPTGTELFVARGIADAYNAGTTPCTMEFSLDLNWISPTTYQNTGHLSGDYTRKTMITPGTSGNDAKLLHVFDAVAPTTDFVHLTLMARNVDCTGFSGVTGRVEVLTIKK